MHAFLSTAIRAARDAGKIILQNMDNVSQLTIEHKAKNDLVSEVDRRAEESITDIIKKYYPEHAILAEESGAYKGKKDVGDILWIIDPLDGTTNFLHGYPRFCVSIAVQVNGRIEHGVVYDPVMDEMYTASRGDGARLNDQRIRVSQAQGLDRGLIATGFPIKEYDQLDNLMTLLSELIPACQGVRRDGAAALDLVNVACGRLDGYFESKLHPWDLAAGSLIVREAGGIIADYRGDSHYLQSGDIIAASPRVFSELQKLIKKHML